MTSRGLLSVLAVAALVAASARAIPAQDADADFDLAWDHVALSVPDIPASIAWYSEMLGFKEVRRGGQPGGMEVALIQRGNIRIELFQVPGAAPLPESRRNPSEDFRTHGVKHFGFAVEDVRALVGQLRAKGVQVAFETRENEREIFAFVSDNAGNAVELIQRKQR